MGAVIVKGCERKSHIGNAIVLPFSPTLSRDIHGSHIASNVLCRLFVQDNHEFSWTALRDSVVLWTETNCHSWMKKIEMKGYMML